MGQLRKVIMKNENTKSIIIIIIIIIIFGLAGVVDNSTPKPTICNNNICYRV